MVSSWPVEQRQERATALKEAGLIGLQFWADPHQGPAEERDDTVRCEPGRRTFLEQPARSVAERVARDDSVIMQGAKRKRHGEGARAHGTAQYWKHKYNGARKNGYQCHAHRYDQNPVYRDQMRKQDPPVPRVAWHAENHPHERGSRVAGQPTGEIVCWHEEVAYLDETGYASDGPKDDKDWVASSAASASGYNPSAFSDAASTSHSMG